MSLDSGGPPPSSSPPTSVTDGTLSTRDSQSGRLDQPTVKPMVEDSKLLTINLAGDQIVWLRWMKDKYALYSVDQALACLIDYARFADAATQKFIFSVIRCRRCGIRFSKKSFKFVLVPEINGSLKPSAEDANVAAERDGKHGDTGKQTVDSEDRPGASPLQILASESIPALAEIERAQLAESPSFSYSSSSLAPPPHPPPAVEVDTRVSAWVANDIDALLARARALGAENAPPDCKTAEGVWFAAAVAGRESSKLLQEVEEEMARGRMEFLHSMKDEYDIPSVDKVVRVMIDYAQQGRTTRRSTDEQVRVVLLALEADIFVTWRTHVVERRLKYHTAASACRNATTSTSTTTATSTTSTSPMEREVNGSVEESSENAAAGEECSKFNSTSDSSGVTVKSPMQPMAAMANIWRWVEISR